MNAYTLRNKLISLPLIEEGQTGRNRCREKLTSVTYNFIGFILSHDEIRQILHFFCHKRSWVMQSFQRHKNKMDHFQFRTSANLSTRQQRNETDWGSLSYWGRNILFQEHMGRVPSLYQNPSIQQNGKSCKLNSSSLMPGSRALLHGRALKVHRSL